MEATPRGLFVGGDQMYQGGVRTGRVAFYDFNTVSAPSPIDTTITSPIEGHVVTAGAQFVIQGQATAPGLVRRVQVEIQDRDTNQYLQDDGSVASSFNTFRGLPDVIGATSATWQYEVTLPHEGQWRMSATAIDTAGQSDLRGATRDWLITSTGVPPTVAINSPAAMTPPTAAAPYTVAPGGPLTFSGAANDDDDLATVEISL